MGGNDDLLGDQDDLGIGMTSPNEEVNNIDQVPDIEIEEFD